jgi:hypothetical protein
MGAVKEKINDISRDTELLINNYRKLFSVALSEKLALILGMIATIFLLSLLILVALLFSSFSLAVFLNDTLPGDYWGFWIVTGLYLLIILGMIIKLFTTKTPLFTNIFIRMILFILSFDEDQVKNLRELENKRENLKDHIETDKDKIKADFELLRYALIGSLIKEFFDLFSRRNKKEKSETTPTPRKTGKKSRSRS